MTIQSEDQGNFINTQTKHIVYEFVEEAISHLRALLHVSEIDFSYDIRFERGSDGNFYLRNKKNLQIWHILKDDWLRLLPGYKICNDILNSDRIIGPHLGNLVGSTAGSSLITTENFLCVLINLTLNANEKLFFEKENFCINWRIFAQFFKAKTLSQKTIIPIPNLIICDLPFKLKDEIMLDNFTDEEVAQAYRVGVLRLTSPTFPTIDRGVAIGVRRIIPVSKVIRSQAAPYEFPDGKDEGGFGKRPYSRGDLAVNDILSAMRLFKSTTIRSTGHVSWIDSVWLNGGKTYKVMGQWPYGGPFELTNLECSEFIELWRLLEEGYTRLGFSIHRFTLAFDRGLFNDRIVDLVIAAEALLLQDSDARNRGELRYRFSMRGAKFINHPDYSEYEIFRIMREAYDVRSAIVHGGSPKKLSLPENLSFDLQALADVFEGLIRIGLRKALSMKKDADQLKKSEYWDNLTLSKAPP